MAELLDALTLAPLEAGDHDRFKHYVLKSKLTDASVYGQPIRALCGKKWVPSADPDRFPMCPECQYIWEGKE